MYVHTHVKWNWFQVFMLFCVLFVFASAAKRSRRLSYRNR